MTMQRALQRIKTLVCLAMAISLSLPNPALALRQLNAGMEESPVHQELRARLGVTSRVERNSPLRHLEEPGIPEVSAAAVRMIFPLAAAGIEEMGTIEPTPEAIATFRQRSDIQVAIYRIGTLDAFHVETDTAPRLQDIFGRMNFVYEFETAEKDHRLVRPDELGEQLQKTGLLNYTMAIDFSMDRVAGFFNQASEDLANGERWLRDTLQREGILVKVGNRWEAAKKSAILGFSQDMEPKKRERLSRHETDHVLFHLIPQYARAITDDFNDRLTDAEREVVDAFLLAWGSYDVRDSVLRVKEYSAYFRDEESVREKWTRRVQQGAAPDAPEAYKRLRALIAPEQGQIKAEWLDWLHRTAERLLNLAAPYWSTLAAGMEEVPLKKVAPQQRGSYFEELRKKTEDMRGIAEHLSRVKNVRVAYGEGPPDGKERELLMNSASVLEGYYAGLVFAAPTSKRGLPGNYPIFTYEVTPHLIPAFLDLDKAAEAGHASVVATGGQAVDLNEAYDLVVKGELVDDEEWLVSHGGSPGSEAGQLAQRILVGVFNGGTSSPFINAVGVVNGFLQKAYQKFKTAWEAAGNDTARQAARQAAEESLETASTAVALFYDKDLQQRGVDVERFRQRVAEDINAFQEEMGKLMSQAPKRPVKVGRESSVARTYWGSAAGLGAYAEHLNEYYVERDLSLGELERFDRKHTISTDTLKALAFLVQSNLSVIQSENDVTALFDEAGTLVARISYYVIDWNVRPSSEDLVSPPASTHGLKPVRDRLGAAVRLWDRLPHEERSRLSKLFVGQALEFKRVSMQPFAGLEEVDGWIHGLGIWSRSIESVQLDELKNKGRTVAEVRGVPSLIRLTTVTQGMLPSAEISRGRQVMAQSDLLPDPTLESLTQQFGAVEPLPRSLSPEAVTRLVSRLKDLETQGPKAMLLVDPETAEQIKTVLAEVDQEWKVPVLIVGIPKGLLDTTDPNAILTYLLNLLAQVDQVPGRHIEWLESTLTLETKHQTLFLSSGA